MTWLYEVITERTESSGEIKRIQMYIEGDDFAKVAQHVEENFREIDDEIISIHRVAPICGRAPLLNS